MPHRLIPIYGYLADSSVFAAAITFLSIPSFGLTYTESGAVLSGIGALLLGLGRCVKYLAEADLVKSQARQLETYTKPEVWQKLEGYKCYNAPECNNRKIIKESHENI